MANEVVETETTSNPDALPAAFDKAMDAIEAEQPSVAEPVESDNSDEQDDVVSGDDTTPASETSAVSAKDDVIGGIPTDTLAAFISQGWDAEKIKSVLEAAKTVQQPQAKPEVKPVVTEPAEDDLKFELDPDIVGLDVKNAIDKITATLNAQKKDIQERQNSLRQEQSQAFNMKIDSHFDNIAKELPELGTSANLTQKQMALRTELFAHANVTASLRGISMEEAIKLEASKVKGMGGEKVAEQKLLDKLKKQNNQLSNKPTRRASEPTRTFDDEADRKEHLMREAERKAGWDA
jgi:hypothetical protein